MNRVLQVSVAHITEETAYELTRGKQIKHVQVNSDSDFFIDNLPRVRLSKVSGDLARVISHALANGFKSLHLAADGKFHQAIPHYDW